MLSDQAIGRTGWCIVEGRAPERPADATIEVVTQLFAYQQRTLSAPHEVERREGWLREAIHRITIIADRFSPFHTKGARSSLGVERFRLPASQETNMETRDQARFRAELEALRELSQEKPLSPEEIKLLLEKRKRDFDESWGIDPDSSTDYTPIRLVK